MLAISVFDHLVGVVSPVSTVTTRAPPPINSSPLGPKAMASMLVILGLPCSAWTNVARPTSTRHAREKERFIRQSSDEERDVGNVDSLATWYRAQPACPAPSELNA